MRNSVRFRSLCAGVFCLAQALVLHADEAIVLFDGKSLDAWESANGSEVSAGWVIEADGSLFRKDKTGDILSKQSFKNFDLEWDWKISEGGNSGLKYWVSKIGKQQLGLEYQLIDDQKHADAKNVNRQAATIYDIKETVADKPLKPVGEWNHSRLLVKDGKLQHWLNGALVVEADTSSDDWKARLAASKYAKYEGFAAGEGRLLLQDHGDNVWFKNIVIKKLAD